MSGSCRSQIPFSHQLPQYVIVTRVFLPTVVLRVMASIGPFLFRRIPDIFDDLLVVVNELFMFTDKIIFTKR